MEALGGVSVRCYSVSGGGGCCPGRLDAQSSKNIRVPAASFSSSVGLRKASCRRRSSGGVFFRERDHLDYYFNYSSVGGRGRGGKMISCGKGNCKVVDKEKEKESKKNKKIMKQRLKKMLQTQIQGGDLPISSEIPGFSPDYDPISPFPDDARVARMISDAAEGLLQQLQQLRLEGRDLEMKNREGSEMMSSDSSSSSSSESSESDSECECGEVVTDMRKQKISSNLVALEPGKSPESEAFPAGIPVDDGIANHNFQQPIPLSEAALASIWGLENQSAAATNQLNHSTSACELEEQSQYLSGTSLMKSPLVAETAGVLSTSAKKVEVCMGGKCKKSGAAALLGEFQRLLGTECASVSSCKCMGKCRDGPNVRISDDPHSNSLCIGVGLADVDAIVANYIGPSPQLGFNAA